MVTKNIKSESLEKNISNYSDRRRYLDVVEEVLKAIAIGNIHAGDRLPNERELARRCEVSRSSAREALLALELSGIIEIRPGSGCFLTGMGLHSNSLISSSIDSSPKELLEVRQMIEPQVAGLCAMRASKQDIENIKKMINDAEEQSNDPHFENIEHFVGLNLGFHRELARSCGNTALTGMISHLVNAREHPLWLLIDGIVVRNPLTRSQQVEEHRIILNHIISGDKDLATNAMTVHLGALAKRIFGDKSSPPKLSHTRRRSR